MKKTITMVILQLLTFGCAAPQYQINPEETAVSELLLTSNHKYGFIINIYDERSCESPHTFARGHVFGGRKSEDGDVLKSGDTSVYSIVKKLKSGDPVNMTIWSAGFYSTCIVPFKFTPKASTNYNLDFNWTGEQCVMKLNEINSQGEHIEKNLVIPDPQCYNGF